MQRGHRAGRRRVPAQLSTPGMSRAGGALPVPGARTPGQSSPACGKVWGPRRGRVQPLARQGRAGRGSVALAGDTSLPGQRPGLMAHPTAGGVPLCVSVSFTVSPSPRGLTPTAPGRCGPAGSVAPQGLQPRSPRADSPPRAR